MPFRLDKLVHQWHRKGQSRLIANYAHLMFAPGVLGQKDVAGAEDKTGPITDSNLILAAEEDDVLPSRRRVPIHGVPLLMAGEEDRLGRLRNGTLAERQVGFVVEANLLEMGLAIMPSEETNNHGALLAV